MEKYEFPAEERKLLEGMKVPFAIFQMVDKRIITLIISDGLSTLFGYSHREDAYLDMAQSTFQFEHPDDAARVADAAVLFATQEDKFDIIYRARGKNDTDYRIIHAIGNHIYTESGVRLAQVAYTDEGIYTGESCRNYSYFTNSLNKALHEESLFRGNYYDRLTGLPNMSYFFELADAGKVAAEKEGGKEVMLFMDLSGMKYFNTKYGYSEGDKLLRAFAELLVDFFSNDNCCRIGADHFAVYTRAEGVEQVLEELFFRAREINEGKSVPVHVGIYVAGTENITASGAFDRAKIAGDSLKNRYGCCYDYYTTKQSSEMEQRQYVLSNLDRALEERWIKVYFQGIVRAVT
ncbi:MAG: GGDEF domain-containing protein, partial [Lachnospiraceae bacterium]|nr:GGDEF domain-containing protein [Lachnospiraceae bacterium]